MVIFTALVRQERAGDQAVALSRFPADLGLAWTAAPI
jgi:hypothetical protein